ncbi:hypothetical protein HFO32_23120 [Rhizobium leguminosarum]|uniref:hypothetical protein n=1 Tax=Rhizobium leguminosarum TaxID=384 RepID=UPI001C9458DA|nr:hypothetical protein [Rhizobium leguminosarum]MBY5672292.1 hypothetical protein [Rhizobium leguminosarum]MBY5684998.1 hypothetical protein [Rhizobium leguminosarum]
MQGVRNVLRLIPAAGILLFGILLSGCASGVPEFQLYVQAYTSQHVHAEYVLDRVARAERIVVRRRLDLENADVDFDPDKAGYYLDTGDPPITGSIRASLNSLNNYNAALGALASGEKAEAIATRMGTLASALIGTAATLVQATGPATFIPSATKPLDEAIQAVNRALPLVKTVATYASRDAFRKQLIAAYPAMRQLLIAMRDATPAMYEIMRRSYVQRGSLESGSGISIAGSDLLLKDRELLAGWVILMDKSVEAMDVSVKTAMTGASSDDLAALTAASLELQVVARQIGDIRKKP